MSDAKENIDMADMDGIRDRILALQRSASNMVQMDLEELSALLPPETSREKLMEIRSKLIQLHALQNGRENAQENEAPNLIAEGVANRSSRYKTELCRPYEENGVCKYGARCQFAHGVAELRNMTRHPKYKSQLCRTFHSNGLCPYGHRCHFIHNEDEARRVVPPKPLGAQANPVLADANANNVLNSRPLPQPLVHEWSRRGGPSNFPNGTYRQAPVSYVVPSLQPANVMQVSSAVPVVNNFNSLTNGRSLGSAGDLSPPVSPIIYSPDDPFSNQIPIRPGYFPSGTSGENSELNLNQMAASARSSVPIVGSWPQANFHTVRRSLRHPSQALPSSVWLNNQEL